MVKNYKVTVKLMVRNYKVTRDKPTEAIASISLRDPLFTIVLDEIPSYNEILYLAPIVRAKAIRAERNKGYKIGLEVGKLFNIPIKPQKVFKNKQDIRGSFIERLVIPVTESKLFCVLHIWRERSKKDPNKGSRKRDVYNAAIKALLDGLTDAGVWIDDNENYHSDFLVSYRGVADTPRMEIIFYLSGR